MLGQTAMAHAIEAFRTPSRHRNAGAGVFPSDMLLVIKAAAGDEATLLSAAGAHSVSAADVQEAAKHYLLRFLLHPEAKGIRLLGLNPGADADTINLHKRWLLKWLHPDRNGNAWEKSLFLKVSTYAETLAHPPPDAQVQETKHRRFRRKKARLSTWTHSEKRVPVKTPWSLAVRLSAPILASIGISLVVVWLAASDKAISAKPLSWFTGLVSSDSMTGAAAEQKPK